ncbi:MAG TPA: Rho termination factor N-terminal domain-containing protein, partial [Streptosporangiaceae bacterium]
MSETLDLFPGSSGELEESPGLSRSAGDSADTAPPAGTSPASAGAVRSRPGADDGSNTAAGPQAGRQAGKGLSAMLMPELQRLAQSLDLTGTARMRKGDLVAAIEERQRGGAGRSANAGDASGRGTGSAPVTESAASEPAARRDQRSDVSDNSAQRGAPAGAGASRPLERDAMDT